MTLYPFTPAGVQDRLEDLYDLPDTALFAEADAIELNFYGWMEGNFALDEPQKDYLHGISKEAANYYGSQCALCFRHRLEIELIYPNPTPGYAKLPESSNTIKVITDDQGNMEVTGSLTFTMTYSPNN